jgi:hypothetical protein
MKSSIFWDITPCTPLKINRRFGGTYLSPPSASKDKTSKNNMKKEASRAWLDAEDGVDMFFRNVG